MLVDESAIKRFAAEFDPQPFHLDDDAARGSVFGGLVASGWHTTAIVMKLLATGGFPLANGIIGLGADVSWPRPTRPGDVLQVESEILEIIPSRSRPNQAILKARSTAFNQNGEPVCVLLPRLVVYRRP